jgi:hypothetical protein
MAGAGFLAYQALKPKEYITKLDKKVTLFLTVRKNKIFFREEDWKEEVEVPFAMYAKDIKTLADKYTQVDVGLVLEGADEGLVNAIFYHSQYPNVMVYAQYDSQPNGA